MEGFLENLIALKEEVTKFDTSELVEQLEPLHRAVFDGDVVKIDELLRRGEDGDDEDGTPLNYTAAHWAALKWDEEILELLDDFGTNMSAVDKTDLRPLHVAALAGNSASLIWLLENTYDIESTDIYDQTPLHQAVLNGSLQAVKILVEHGASMEATDEFGMTPICFAVARGYGYIVEYLLQKGANPAVRDIDGKTLLHASSAINDVTTIASLLKVGINVNAKDNMNCTPLHDAAKNDCFQAISLLLQHGADKKSADIDGLTPFDVAKESGHTSSIAILIDEEKHATADLSNNIKIIECYEVQIYSTSCLEPNFKDWIMENSLKINANTSYLEGNGNNTIIGKSDTHITNNHSDTKKNNILEMENVTGNGYCNDNFDDSEDNDENEICCDGSGNEEKEYDFSAMTVDDINKIIY